MARTRNDDFFGSSFGDRLAVSSTRPIVGEVSVDSTEVVPVPLEGRPADYRVRSVAIASSCKPLRRRSMPETQ